MVEHPIGVLARAGGGGLEGARLRAAIRVR